MSRNEKQETRNKKQEPRNKRRVRLDFFAALRLCEKKKEKRQVERSKNREPRNEKQEPRDKNQEIVCG